MFSLDYLVHAGALLFLMGFVVRDRLLLRGFIVIGTIFYVIYYLPLPEPLWSALSWNSLFIIINCVMMFLIYLDRAKFSMTKEEVITNCGETPDKLFFILEGTASIKREEKTFKVGPGIFISELAFLTKNTATANVCLNNQAKGVSWDSSELTRLLATRPQMKVAFDSLLNNDLASKLSHD